MTDYERNADVSKTLTEKWKKGELEWHKSYYCQNRKGEVTKAICLGDSELHSEELGGTLNIGYWKVLAPVPSYEEWKAKENNEDFLQQRISVLESKNQQLKELLKEVRYALVIYKPYDRNQLCKKIDNAIGEK